MSLDWCGRRRFPLQQTFLQIGLDLLVFHFVRRFLQVRPIITDSGNKLGRLSDVDIVPLRQDGQILLLYCVFQIRGLLREDFPLAKKETSESPKTERAKHIRTLLVPSRVTQDDDNRFDFGLR